MSHRIFGVDEKIADCDKISYEESKVWVLIIITKFLQSF